MSNKTGLHQYLNIYQRENLRSEVALAPLVHRPEHPLGLKGEVGSLGV